MHEAPQSAPASVRFWESRRNNVGAVLALLAGLITAAVVVWPGNISAGQSDAQPIWRFMALAAGVGYVVSFRYADSNQKLSKALLVLGAFVQTVVAVTLAGWLERATTIGSGNLSSLFDILPAVLALGAALLIRRAPGPAEMDER
jgi:drug/metabolite transporter (DMT)-like permease